MTKKYTLGMGLCSNVFGFVTHNISVGLILLFFGVMSPNMVWAWTTSDASPYLAAISTSKTSATSQEASPESVPDKTSDAKPTDAKPTDAKPTDTEMTDEEIIQAAQELEAMQNAFREPMTDEVREILLIAERIATHLSPDEKRQNFRFMEKIFPLQVRYGKTDAAIAFFEAQLKTIQERQEKYATNDDQVRRLKEVSTYYELSRMSRAGLCVESIRIGLQSSSPLIRAGALWTLTQMQAATGDVESASRSFDQTLRWLEKIPPEPPMPKTGRNRNGPSRRSLIAMEMIRNHPSQFSWNPELILRAGEFLPPSKPSDKETDLYETLAKAWCEHHRTELDAGDFESALQRAEATGADLAQTVYVRAVIERQIRSGNWDAVQPVIDRIFPLGSPKKKVAADMAAIFGRFDGRDLCLETYALRSIQYGRITEAMRIAEMIEEKSQKYRTVNKMIGLLIDKPTATNVLYGLLPDSVLGGETTETTIPKPQYTQQELLNFFQWYGNLDQENRPKEDRPKTADNTDDTDNMGSTDNTGNTGQPSDHSNDSSLYTQTKQMKHLIATADLALLLGLHEEAEKWYDLAMDEMLQITPELRKQEEQLDALFQETVKSKQADESNEIPKEDNEISKEDAETPLTQEPKIPFIFYFPEELIDRLIAIPLEAKDYDTVSKRLRQCEERGIPISCQQKIQLLCQMEHFDEAMRIVDENMTVSPEMIISKIEILYCQKRWDEAIKWVDSDEECKSWTNYLLICALAEDGQQDRAMERFRIYQREEPELWKYSVSELPYALQEQLFPEMEPQQQLEYWIRQAYHQQASNDRPAMEKCLLEAIRILESIDKRCETLDQILRFL